MRHRTRPLPAEPDTLQALKEGRDDKRLHPRRRQHYQALLLRVRGVPIPVIAQRADIDLSAGALYKITAQFKKEGLAFLDYPYRCPRPGHKRPGPAPTLDDEQLRRLSCDDVLEGALTDIRAWIKAETGRTVSLKTASRWRLRAEKLRKQGWVVRG